MWLASHKRLFDPQDVAPQLFVRKTEDLFLFCNCTYISHFQLFCGRRLFCSFIPIFICISYRVEDFFCSFIHRRQLFGCSTFPQVIFSMKILPTFKLHNNYNDSHIVRFFRSSKLCCPDAKPSVTCYCMCISVTPRVGP